MTPVIPVYHAPSNRLFVSVVTIGLLSLVLVLDATTQQVVGNITFPFLYIIQSLYSSASSLFALCVHLEDTQPQYIMQVDLSTL
jgi:hypothetical protein